MRQIHNFNGTLVLFIFEFCRKYSERFGLGQVFLLHKPCGGMIFPNNDICLLEMN